MNFLLQRRWQTRWRQCAGILGLALVVAACAPDGAREEQNRRIFLGGVVADEPRAALAGQTVLEQGGTAADALTATFFALTATYPVAAGLGGGGTCVYFDGLTRTAESIEFLPHTPAGGGEIAIPGAVRGVAAIHSRFGRLRWAQVVLPAESLARLGHPASRSLVRRTGEYVARVPNAALSRLAGSGSVIAEGAKLEQPELATTLSQIRLRGAGDFYFGQTATAFIDGTAPFGGRITEEDLRSYLPQWKRVETINFASLALYTNAAQPPGGTVAAATWAMLTERDRYRVAPAEERSHLLAESSARAFTDVAAGASFSAFRAQNLLANYNPAQRVAPSAALDLGPWARAITDGSTGVVAVDREGSAVACAFSMGAPFGIGRAILPMGVYPAPSGPIDTESWLQSGNGFLAPLLIANPTTGELVFAGVGSNGPMGITGVVQAGLGAIVEGRSLAQAVSAPRLFSTGASAQTFIEPGYPDADRAELERRGHAIVPTQQGALVNAISCFGGLKLDPGSCELVTDPRGYGMAAGGLGGFVQIRR